jgi:hypothetical protein
MTESTLADAVTEGISALMAVVETPFSRWPAIRLGARRSLPVIVRRLVFARDNWHCRTCGTHDVPLEVDHIVPWSAGGTDSTENLRLLCEWCNNRRSNRKEVFYPSVLPCAEVCTPCWLELTPDFEPEDARIAAWCGYCGLTSWVDTDRALW